MAATAPLLTTLLKNTSLDDHEEILRACNASLKKSKSDLEAQHVKAIALLKLDRYDDAVKSFEDHGTKLQEKAGLEYAYALYKVGRLKEAAEVSSKIQEPGSRYIEAQANYRLENSKLTRKIYQEIKDQINSSEDFDLRVNQGAIDAQTLWLGTEDVDLIRRPGREDLEAFETAYNAACGSIAKGELSQADILLKRAKDLCKHSDDLSEEQKADELLTISVQQLYNLLRLGKKAEAEAIAQEINISNISDLSTRSIAQHNILTSSSSQHNPFYLHKALHSTPKIPDNDKLFSYQTVPFDSNQKAIDLQCHKHQGIATSTTTAIKNHESSSISQERLLLSVFNAAAYCKNETNKAALTKLSEELKQNPDDVGLAITFIQISLLNGDTTSAIRVLETLFRQLESNNKQHDVRYNAGLVSTLIGLYKKQGRKADVRRELAKAAEHWQGKTSAPASLLHAAGLSLLQSTDAEEVEAASLVYEKLHQQQPDNKDTLAGYVASHSANIDSKIDSYVAKLTSISELTRDTDLNLLETSGIPVTSSAQSHALAIAQLGQSSRKRRAPDGTNSKTKRVRKSKLPKDYDPNKKPDPERWLPLRDRSSYRPPKSKKKAKKGAGDDRTQGGVVNDDLNFDVTAKVPAANPTVNTASGGGAGNKKKKGKGKK